MQTMNNVSSYGVVAGMGGHAGVINGSISGRGILGRASAAVRTMVVRVATMMVRVATNNFFMTFSLCEAVRSAVPCI